MAGGGAMESLGAGNGREMDPEGLALITEIGSTIFSHTIRCIAVMHQAEIGSGQC